MPKFRNLPVDLAIDVRSKLEFLLGHLPGATHIPGDHLPDALADRPGIKKNSRILLYCASGARSSAAAARLSAAGYTRVVDGGGMSAAARDYSEQ
ncbi:MAG: rhodanese-like domain-containing protein [Gemmatimonadaceae bacterium]